MIKAFLKMFFAQLAMMALVTWNFRMISSGNVPMVALTETIWAIPNFWYMKYFIKDQSTAGWVGYSLGCIVGTTSSVYLTKLLS